MTQYYCTVNNFLHCMTFVYLFKTSTLTARSVKCMGYGSFVCLDFTARQHINGYIVPNAIISLKYYVKLCKWQ
jgi:hypothetical protein